MKRRALILGRFQPFHKGHLKAVKDVVEDGYEPIIVLGSSQKSLTLENPFTCGERIEMVDATLRYEGIDNYFILGVPDIDDNFMYTTHLKRYTPKFDVVYAGSPLTIDLFESAGYDVVQMQRLTLTNDRKDPPEEIKTSGTLIRQMMADGDETWKDMVPKGTYEKIEEFDGTKRLNRLKHRLYRES